MYKPIASHPPQSGKKTPFSRPPFLRSASRGPAPAAGPPAAATGSAGVRERPPVSSAISSHSLPRRRQQCEGRPDSGSVSRGSSLCPGYRSDSLSASAAAGLKAQVETAAVRYSGRVPFPSFSPDCTFAEIFTYLRGMI